MSIHNVLFPFFSDKSHFAFSAFVILPGSIIAFYLLKKIPLLLSEFVDNEIITSPEEEVNKLFYRFQKKSDSIFIHVLFVIISLVGFFIFIGFTRGENFIMWWGNVEYGWAGIYFALIIFVMLYHGLFILYISYLFVIFIRDLMKFHIKLRPFHPDNCNGYKPLGNIILILFGLSIVVAIAVFIVLFLGFLDLQKTVFIWFLIMGCLGLTPLLLLLPSYFVVSKLKAEKNKLLQIIERRMNQITGELEKQLIDDEGVGYHDKIDDLLKVKDSFSIYNDITVWPYNIKLIQTIVLTYILQIALLLYESMKQ